VSEIRKPSRLPERNPDTYARHRKEVFWQITFPFLLTFLIILLLLAGVIWAGVAGHDQLRRWADTSIVWLLIPPTGLSLLLLAINVGMVVAVAKLLNVLPGAMRLVQDYFKMIEMKVKDLADKMVEPVLKIHGFIASFSALKRK